MAATSASSATSMRTRAAGPTSRHHRRGTVLVALVVAGLLGGVGLHLRTSTGSGRPLAVVASPWPAVGSSTATGPPAAAGEADGVVAGDVTVFDDIPAVGNLDGELVAALRRAATDAAGDGIELHVNSGWRSPTYQQQLLREAIARYGSAAEAARWVAPANRSEHVSGHAVDIGPRGAAAWLGAHGARYGLCRTYANEPWHFELRPDAVDRGCPAPYADPTQDPRLQP